MIKVVSLRKIHETSNAHSNINKNKTYNVLNTIKDEPVCRSALERKLPNCWRVLKRVVDKGFVVKLDNNKYYITEDGLDKIDMIKIEYGIYVG